MCGVDSCFYFYTQKQLCFKRVFAIAILSVCLSVEVTRCQARLVLRWVTTEPELL